MTTKESFSMISRILFILFSLVYIKFVFYEWDGYSYYMGVMDFFPHFSFSYILWTALGVIPFLLLWSILYMLYWVISKLLNMVRLEHMTILFIIFIFSYFIKVSFFNNIYFSDTSIWVSILFVIIIIGFLSRYIDKMLSALNERIVPLVWIFTFIFILAIPFSIYNVFQKPASPAEYISDNGASSDANKLNILLVTVDTLSAYDMQLYGYSYPTTPFLSEWSKDAVVFNRAYSSSNWTTPSTMSLMTGQRTWTHGVWYFAYKHPLKNYMNNLPYVLKENGYNNYAYVQNKHAHPDILGIGNNFVIKDHFFTFKKYYRKKNKVINDLVIFFLNRPIARDFLEVHPVFLNIEANVIKIMGGRNNRQKPVGVSANKSTDNRKKYVHKLSLQTSDKLPTRSFGNTSNVISHKMAAKTSNNQFDNVSSIDTPSERVYNRFLKNISEGKIKEPYFAWLHTLPPHDPYYPPRQYRGVFGKGRNYDINGTYRINNYDIKHQKRVDRLRSHYDDFILYSDDQFGDFMNRLSSSIDLSNTLIIFSSDHGESFSHGYQGHSSDVINEPMVNIPLIIKKPGINTGSAVNTPVSIVDIPPTILEAAGIPVPEWFEGRSLMEAVNGGEMAPMPVFSTYFQRNSSFKQEISEGSVAVWDNNYKLVRNLKSKENILFNIALDPLETHDIINEKPDIAQRLIKLIDDNIPSEKNKYIENQ